jgi:hypothetical protein
VYDGYSFHLDGAVILQRTSEAGGSLCASRWEWIAVDSQQGLNFFISSTSKPALEAHPNFYLMGNSEYLH